MNNLLTAKILRVLDCVADAEAPLTLKELRSRTGLPAAVVSRICADLVEGGYLERDGYHAVAAAPGLLRLGAGALRNSPFLRQSLPILRARAANLGVRTSLVGLSGGKLCCFFRSASWGGIGTASREPWWRFEAAALLLAPEEGETAENFSLRVAASAGGEVPGALLPELPRIAAEKRVVRRDLLHGWNVALPLPEHPGYAVSLFGVELPALGSPQLRMLEECRRLAERIDDALPEPAKRK